MKCKCEFSFDNQIPEIFGRYWKLAEPKLIQKCLLRKKIRKPPQFQMRPSFQQRLIDSSENIKDGLIYFFKKYLQSYSYFLSRYIFVELK